MNSIKLNTRDHKLKLSTLRDNNIVPGVVYGNGLSSLNVQLPLNKLKDYLNKDGEIYKITTKDGERFVKFESVQKSVMGDKVIHFSMVSLRKGEETSIDIPLELVGESAGQRNGGAILKLQDSVSLTGRPSEFPKKIELDISNLKIGENLDVSNLNIDDEFKVNESSDAVLVVCTPPTLSYEEEVISSPVVEQAAS